MPLPVLEFLPIIKEVIDRIMPDKAQAEKAKQELEKLDLNAALKLAEGQLEVNKAEAGHSSVFVAGWRPFIGWICGVSLAVQALIYPLTILVYSLYLGKDPGTIRLDTENLMYILMSMLGMAWTRTYEKKIGVK